MSLQYEDHQENHSQSNGSMRRKINLIPWLLVIIMGVLLISNYYDGTLTISNSLKTIAWLPLLLSLVCPLMMLLMMFGMRGHGCHQDNGSNQNVHGHGGCCGRPQVNKESGK